MIFWLISFGLGAAAVVQAGLNREIGKTWGLAAAIAMNGFFLAIFAALFLFLNLRFPQLFPESFQARGSWSEMKWWYWLPAVCGFALVTGIPSLLPRLGASGVFLCIVVGQMTFSLLWDLGVEGMTLDLRRLLGVGMALAGLLVSSWGRM